MRGETRLEHGRRRRLSRRGSFPVGCLGGNGLVGGSACHGPRHAAGTWAKTAGAMRPWMSVHTSLTSVVAHTMGFQFPGWAQSPFL